MHIAQILRKPGPRISFEFFPPRTPEASEQLFTSIQELMPLRPAYVSVTYGAGGSTRSLTHDLVVRIQQETSLSVVSHLTCVGHTRAQMQEILSRYHASGIMNVLALRGDPPRQSEGPLITEFAHASDLLRFIKEQQPEMGIGVAGFPEGHPETPNRLKEMENLKGKVDAGADYICTQMFFDNRDFFDFRERCELARIRVPIIAGIMPITSRAGMERMAELALGIRYPARLLKAIERCENDEQVARVGIHWATEQVLDLMDQDVRDIHFYTLNRSRPTLAIHRALGLADAALLKDQI
ncbi:MAG: methylenetetrahydrofolate reductase [NAD(P)H] [Spirochaetales bacterium]|nr:methylenetetrahydrofolate reductase [NAD(P)H] [Spirochaetales bacterium]